MENVTYIDHPLVQHKISMLRKKTTGTNEFRTLVEEIATLMGYEALRDLPLEDVEVETPIETCMTPMLAGKKLAIVPILRAGLGMVNGVLSLVPSAKIGHIGLYRDEETHEPHEYFCKLPNPIEQRTIVVTDPMLATGGSAVAAIDFIKQHGGKHIKFMCIIAAPEGVKRLHEAHPDVKAHAVCDGSTTLITVKLHILHIVVFHDSQSSSLKLRLVAVHHSPALLLFTVKPHTCSNELFIGHALHCLLFHYCPPPNFSNAFVAQASQIPFP